MTVRVTGIRSVAIDVCALDEAAAFYADVWKLTPVASADGARYFGGTCAHHHILGLHGVAQSRCDIALDLRRVALVQCADRIGIAQFGACDQRRLRLDRATWLAGSIGLDWVELR